MGGLNETCFGPLVYLFTFGTQRTLVTSGHVCSWSAMTAWPFLVQKDPKTARHLEDEAIGDRRSKLVSFWMLGLMSGADDFLSCLLSD